MNCPTQETEVTSTPTSPVDNVVITTKGLQDRNIHIIDGTTVENKGKSILKQLRVKKQKQLKILHGIQALFRFKHNNLFTMTHPLYSLHFLCFHLYPIIRKITGCVKFIYPYQSLQDYG